MGVEAIQRTVAKGGAQFSEKIKREGRTESRERSFHESNPMRVLSKNQAFDVLRNSRRRAAIAELRDRGGSMSVEKLSRRVAADEYGIAPEEVSAEQYKRVYTGLYQCHLGRMEDLGVVDFERDENRVDLLEAASDLERYLDDGRDPEAARIEFGLATAVALVVALGLGGVGPFGAISLSLLAGVTVAALLGLALFQLFGHRSFFG